MYKQNSQKVKNWRQKTKERSVKAFNSKCCICGYSKSTRSLSFHHINSEEKKFSISGIRGHPRSWKIIVNELRKCVMLCANCHMEVEDGITNLPEKPTMFNEEYATYISTQGKLIGE